MNVKEYMKHSPLLFDGAMGTYFPEKAKAFTGEYCELANLTDPACVQAIHEEYLRAGAVAIKTNTFAANRLLLQMGQEKVFSVIRAGVDIANRAAGRFGGDRFVFADIGPVPVGEDADLFEEYRAIADCFLACRTDGFLFETMESSEALSEIASYIKEKKPDTFIAVSFAASPEGYTRAGFLAKKLFWQMQESEAVDAVGFNCISGPKHLLELVQGLSREQMKKYLTVMPNAGYPTVLKNRVYYGTNREYFGQTAYELILEGASVVGGCCGTTPEDIACVSKLMREQPVMERAKKKKAVLGKPSVPAQKEDGSKNPKNPLAQKLLAGERVIVVELDPPVEPDIDFFMEGAARYKYAGVDAIDIADCPIAKARIDSSLLACKVMRELKLPTVPHLTCRDRNINATKALLLGLNIEGVNNVLTVTGDPVPVSARNEIKTVFSYNSAVLARHINSFNQEIFTENPFMVSGALNVNAVQFDAQLKHAKSKIANGVSLLFTQPVLSQRGLENLKRAKKELGVWLLGGIMPVVSYRNAAFMNSEMAGIDVAEEIMEQYRDKTREEGEKLAYEISVRMMDEMRDYVDGYYLITPFKRINLMLKIIEYAKTKNRAK